MWWRERLTSHETHRRSLIQTEPWSYFLAKAFLNIWSINLKKKKVDSNCEREELVEQDSSTNASADSPGWPRTSLTFGAEVGQNQSQEQSSGLRLSRPPHPQRLHESSSQRTWRSEPVAQTSNHFWFRVTGPLTSLSLEVGFAFRELDTDASAVSRRY